MMHPWVCYHRCVVPSTHLPRWPEIVQTRFFAVILALVSVAAVVFAWINFQKEREFSAPYDGIWWVEDGGHLRAARVDSDGPGEKAGIKLDDRLVAVDGRNVTNVGSLERQLYRAGIWSKANYSLVRQGVNLEAPLILAPTDRSLYGGLRLIALVYLGIGIYVLLRRWTAPKSTHFYVFCLVSFIFYSFHYTGKLNDFDWIVYWSNVVAWLLQPALFLHFSLTFPERKGLVNRRPWLIPAVYVPGFVLLAAHICAVSLLQPSEVLRWNLDRLQMSYLAAYFVLSAAVLWHSYRYAESAILRQQMKWVTRGTILAVAPFTLFYVIPYLVGKRSQSSYEGLGVVVGLSAADLRLCHLPLPLDGCGPHLQARNGLYDRCWCDYRSLFRGCGHCFGAVPSELPQRRADRTGSSHRGNRVCCSIRSRIGYRITWTSSSTVNVTTTGKR